MQVNSYTRILIYLERRMFTNSYVAFRFWLFYYWNKFLMFRILLCVFLLLSACFFFIFRSRSKKRENSNLRARWKFGEECMALGYTYVNSRIRHTSCMQNDEQCACQTIHNLVLAHVSGIAGIRLSKLSKPAHNRNHLNFPYSSIHPSPSIHLHPYINISDLNLKYAEHITSP